MGIVRSFPVRVGELLSGDAFPFESWASAHGFVYPSEALPLLRRCGSAAEAYFVRAYLVRAWDGVPPGIELQVPCRGYRIDAVVRSGDAVLAIEIDGMAFHHRSKEQVAADYARERRIVAGGYPVIRFTARECFATPAACWDEIANILTALDISRAG